MSNLVKWVMMARASESQTEGHVHDVEGWSHLLECAACSVCGHPHRFLSAEAIFRGSRAAKAFGRTRIGDERAAT